MPIDPNIALSFRQPEIENPLNQFAKISAIQNAQNQNALAQYQLSSAKRADEEANAMRASLPADFDISNPAHVNALLKASPVGGAALIEKLAKVRKEQVDTQKTQSEITDATLKRSRDLLSSVSTPEDFMRWNLANHNDPVIGPLLKARGITPESSAVQIVTAMAQPGGFQQLLQQSALGLGKFIELNKPTLTSQNLGDTERIVATPGLGGPSTVVPGSEAKVGVTPSAALSSQTQLATNAATNARIAAEGAANRGQAQSHFEQNLALKKQGLEELPPKEIQKREAAYPQATAAVKAIETNTDNLVGDLIALRDHPGLSQISGIAAGRMPGITAEGRAAQALYDKIVAKGGFQVLQDMRAASKTGGALGNISDKEGAQLKSAFAAIDRRQDAPDVKKAIDEAIDNAKTSKQRVREAYDTTYEYKAGKAAPAAGNVPVATKSGATVSAW